MKKAFCFAILFPLSVAAVGCGGGGYQYEEPPPNADVSEEVQRDAGVVTDESLMSSGADQQ